MLAGINIPTWPCVVLFQRQITIVLQYVSLGFYFCNLKIFAKLEKSVPFLINMSGVTGHLLIPIPQFTGMELVFVVLTYILGLISANGNKICMYRSCHSVFNV